MKIFCITAVALSLIGCTSPPTNSMPQMSVDEALDRVRVHTACGFIAQTMPRYWEVASNIVGEENPYNPSSRNYVEGASTTDAEILEYHAAQARQVLEQFTDENERRQLEEEMVYGIKVLSTVRTDTKEHALEDIFKRMDFYTKSCMIPNEESPASP